MQIGVALHDPDIAKHFVEYAGGAAGTVFGAQIAEQAPRVFAKQADDDLAVGERGVVVGDFAQAGDGAGARLAKLQRVLSMG